MHARPKAARGERVVRPAGTSGIIPWPCSMQGAFTSVQLQAPPIGQSPTSIQRSPVTQRNLSAVKTLLVQSAAVSPWTPHRQWEPPSVSLATIAAHTDNHDVR